MEEKIQLSVFGCLFSVIMQVMIQDVTDLTVYNFSLELLEPLYALTKQIPSDHRKIKYQANEAGEKIAPQIAEGFGKKKAPREFCRFLSMAIGSSDEVITHIREIAILARQYTRISIGECEALIANYKILSKKLNKLHTSWQRFR